MCIDNELDDLLDFEEWNELEELDRRRRLRNLQRIDPFQEYSDQEFIKRFRLSKELFQLLLEKIAHRLPASNNNRGM